jgi:hypothetical protein
MTELMNINLNIFIKLLFLHENGLKNPIMNKTY